MIKNLKLVEIELSSYCNRKCDWCPNKLIDRYSFNQFLDADILVSLLKELSENNYKGAITFSRNNEPMAVIEYFKEKVSMIKKTLPNNKLITNTNGDFLTKENLEGLEIDELSIMDYDCIGEDKCIDKLEKAGVSIDKIEYPYIYGHYNKMLILLVIDWKKVWKIADRGGILREYSKKIRTLPCKEPFFFVGVNYDGTISPCCNIRSDEPKHKKFLLGDLKENNLETILKSTTSEFMRHSCKDGIYTEGSPCLNCEHMGGRFTNGNGGIAFE